jgi:hypothetical protein
MKYIQNENDCKVFLNKISDTYSGADAPTKLEFAKEMLSNLDFDFSNPTKKILIPYFGFGTIFYLTYLELKKYHSDNHIFENMLFGMEENNYKISLLKVKLPVTNICKDCFLNKTYIDTQSYDLIILNSPFEDDMDFLSMKKGFELLKNGGTLISLHRAHLILNKKRIYGVSDVDNDERVILELIANNKCKIRFIDGRKHISKVQDRTPLAITYITKNETPSLKVRYEYCTNDKKFIELESIDDIWIHGNHIHTKSIILKLLSKKTSSLRDREYKPAKGTGLSLGWYLRISLIASDFPSIQTGTASGYYCLIPKTTITKKRKIIFNRKQLSNLQKGGQYISFSTKKEAQNCADFLICKFGRFLVSLYKTNSNFHRGELEILPNLDFTKKWTSIDLYEYFSISNEEIDFIESYIEDWYDFEFKNKK